MQELLRQPRFLKGSIMIIVLLAEGFEEIEALSVVDILRRGGVEIETVSITNDKKVPINGAIA